MKKILSLILLVFSISFVMAGCKECNKPGDKPAVTDEKPAETEAGKTEEEKK